MNKKAFQDKPDDGGGNRYRILVIDGSRVVRATLAKRLGDRFDIIQEANGESAWQRLMLDGNIAAVISGIHPPRLYARDLLGRLRTSAMRRLREIPFILIVSDVENHTAPEYGGWSDVTGFITKSMDTAAMTASLNQWLGCHDTGSSNDVGHEKESPPVSASTSANERFLGHPEFALRVSSLSLAGADQTPVGVLVFGIDRLDELIARFGQDVPEVLTSRLARLLAAKVGQHDQLGLFGKERLAIISHGVDLRQGMRFGKRVCKSLASGQITIRGQKVRLTVSVGVASTSDDKVASGQELLALAEQRMQQALVCGGNTACIEHRPECPMHCQDKSLITLLEVLKGVDDDLLSEQRRALGLAVLPLLQTLESRLSLGLPLADIKHRLGRQTGAESKAPQ